MRVTKSRSFRTGWRYGETTHLGGYLTKLFNFERPSDRHTTRCAARAHQQFTEGGIWELFCWSVLALVFYSDSLLVPEVSALKIRTERSPSRRKNDDVSYPYLYVPTYVGTSRPFISINYIQLYSISLLALESSGIQKFDHGCRGHGTVET